MDSKKIQAVKDNIDWCCCYEERMDNPNLNNCHIRKRGNCTFRKCSHYSRLPYVRQQLAM
jgi:hypothetical protein